MYKNLLKVLVAIAITPLGGGLLPGDLGVTPPDEDKP